jgi:SPP1 gp7 family putative phage head morphogenesis protein
MVGKIRMPNNEEYWTGRAEYLTERLLDRGEAFFKESLIREYEKAIAGIEEQIEIFYARFAAANEIELADAQRILTTDERRRFQMRLEEFIEKGRTLNYSDQWLKVLENASKVFRVTRLQELQFYMKQIIEELSARVEPKMTTALGNIYEEGYYLQLYELAKGMEAAVRFDRVDPVYVEKLLSKPWAADGYVFSERIWRDRDKLNNYLETRFTQGMMRAEGKAKVVRDMADKMAVSERNAGRLVMTETAYFASAATQDAYKTQGVKEFKFVATLDKSTSEVCQNQDGVVLPISQYKPGVSAPPLHVYCRSTTIPVVEDIWDTEGDERAARDENGKYVRVPASLTYKAWFNEYAKQ